MDSFYPNDLTPDPDEQRHFGPIFVSGGKNHRTMLSVFYYTVWGKGLDDLGKRFASIKEAIYWVIDDPLLYDELMDLLEYQYMKIDFVDKPLDGFRNESPLDLYCSYTLDQILVALGKHTEKKKSSFREGVPT